MGEHQVKQLSSDEKRDFLHHLLCDIRALERMIDDGLIESGVRRIGAEQEYCLIADDMRPALTGPQILAATHDSHFTTELAQWNLEINLDPQPVGPGCFHDLAAQLNQLLAIARDTAKPFDSRVLLTGIMPTIRQSDLDFSCMTPNPRYRLIDAILKELRGENFQLNIEGVDEIILRHDSILFEACNTSFQVHLQVDPTDFVDQYNWAQIIGGPVLACCVNSPILLGRELWAETRIALFRQSIDVRHAANYISNQEPRVAFGQRWLHTNAAQLFKWDVAMYPALIAADIGNRSSLDLLEQGEIPKLRAMNMHNGTLYKWNRACYGVGNNGKPHLRIENRYIASGPTPSDEIANTVFWVGLMLAMPDEQRGAWDRCFWFQDVRCNFLKAARNGLSNQLVWFGKSVQASELILDTLLPMAAAGLDRSGVPRDEYSPFLKVIEDRVKCQQTGAQWIIDSLRSLRRKHTVDECLLMISQAMVENCLSDVPGHLWSIPNPDSLSKITGRNQRVESIMIMNVVVVRDDDLLELAATLMEWNDFHHLPVENARGKIKGIISANDIAEFVRYKGNRRDAIVRDCMSSDVVSVTPETSMKRAEELMINNSIGSLPVVSDGRIVGIVTVNDIRRLNSKRKP
jgi:CBS domain-containing protein